MEKIEDRLKNLLEDAREFGCEYGEALSNHLPMALIALQRIGASKSQLDEFFSFYSPMLASPPKENIWIDSKNWEEHLGQHRLNLTYRDFLAGELKTNGRDATLKKYLPQLIDGVSGGAFHPLIRLAYAIEIDSEWEIAEALASWCMAYQQLGAITHTQLSGSVNLFGSLERLSEEVKRCPVNIEGGTVFAWFKSVSESEAFKNFYSKGKLPMVTLPQIADATIKLYLSTNDSFTALHCVTATHALRVVSRYFNDPIACQYLWQAVCATYVVIKCLPIQEVKMPSDVPSWEDIFEAARKQQNDHAIKFTYSAYCESEHYLNPLYRLAAARKLKLV